MADQDLNDPPEDESGSWRRWATFGGIAAAVLLVGLLVMVALSNRQRDEALDRERRSYEVMLLSRTVDGTVARAEATLARFVLDEDPQTGRIYSSQWQSAGYQISQLRRLLRGDPAQLKQIEDLRRHYDARGAEFAQAASNALSKKESGGVPFFYQAGLSQTGPAMREMLDRISAIEREKLRDRRAQTRAYDQQADALTEYLGWFGVLLGFGAVVLGFLAFRAVSERLIARTDAENEAGRAVQLEHAVEERTRELLDANERLRAEAAERAVAEDKLRQAQKMDAIGQLTGGIAHDFNNMLAVVVGGIDLARRKLRGPKRDVEYHLDNAMEGANRAAALTRRLLAFARSETLTPQATAPAELIEGMLDLIDRSLGERVQVETRFPREPWRVWADANELENAILNLCVNGRDAMNGEGLLGIHVDNVSLYAQQVGELPEGEYVRIGISDTGTGIAPEHLDRVFEPFFTTKPVGKGTGLGLSQIFGFARQSGGDIVIDSAVGAGTTVSLYLPRSLLIAETAEARSPAANDATETELPVAGTVILVVEDDPRVSRSTVGSLEELGYCPLACGSGAEALDILAARSDISLLITDVMMPEMTGPELVRLVDERHPGIPVLFVTGYVGDAGEDELAGHHVLHKPFAIAALREAVRAALSADFSPPPPVSASAAAE